MDTEFNKTQVIKYLIFTFGIAYAIQIIVWLLYSNGYTMVGQCVMAVMMFIPMLGTVLSGYKLKGMGWKPHIKQNWKEILIAWFSPIILTTIGAGLYFALFPSHFDLSGSYMMEIAGEDSLETNGRTGLVISYACSAFMRELHYICTVDEYAFCNRRGNGLERFFISSVKGKVWQKTRLDNRRYYMGIVALSVNMADRL